VRLLAFLVLAACSHPSPTAAPPAAAEKCGDHDACVAPATCVSYYGIAGPSGPQFKSCEIKCDGTACPNGLTCTTIADGPGSVCR